MTTIFITGSQSNLTKWLGREAGIISAEDSYHTFKTDTGMTTEVYGENKEVLRSFSSHTKDASITEFDYFTYEIEDMGFDTVTPPFPEPSNLQVITITADPRVLTHLKEIGEFDDLLVNTYDTHLEVAI